MVTQKGIAIVEQQRMLVKGNNLSPKKDSNHKKLTIKRRVDTTQKLIDLGLKLAGRKFNDYSNPPDAEYSNQLPVKVRKMQRMNDDD